MPLCLNCSGPIVGRKPSETNKMKFCSISCSTTYNNKKFPKRRGLNKNYKKKCVCGNSIKSKRKYCDACWKVNNSEFRKGRRMIYESLNVKKADLFDKCKNWQSASSSIRNHSRKVYEVSDKPKCCDICGYTRHFEICHKKSVSDFHDDANVRDEINHIDNLVALCPTHHWELDNGFLSY